MQSIGKRFASTLPSRKGRKGRLYVPSPEPAPVTPEESVRITKRRIAKAERDERMDITLALTPPKEYMGGFTRPRDLRASNWFPGGAYNEKGKVYESPPPAAYESHTVFLLESRYPVKHGVGRPDSYEHLVGVCRECDLTAVIDKFNSDRCPSDEKEAMDNALWPFLPAKPPKRTVWWAKGEDPKQVLQQLLDDLQRDAPEDPAPAVPAQLLAASAAQRPSPVHKRTYHASARALKDEDPAPASAWSKPHKQSQDAHDDVVPAYYLDRQRPDADGGLMPDLNAGILTEGLAAQTRARDEKIPVEVRMDDGTVVHPSGFEPPTPETDFHPVAAKSPTPADEAESAKVTWEEVLVPPTEDDAPSLAAPTTAAAAAGKLGTSSSSSSRGMHTSAVLRATESKIPMHLLRARAPAPHLARPSSPPFPSQQQQQSDEPDEFDEDDDSPSGPSPSPGNAKKDPYMLPSKSDPERTALRAQYLPLLPSQPFWRPLLTATLSTRPLAVSLARLSRAHVRGLPFYASIPDEDRKYGVSFSARMRGMRLNRMKQLTVDLARALRGERGGLVGIRFGVGERGRGIGGEGLADPIPREKRVVKVGVGEWYALAREVKEGFVLDGVKHELLDGLEVFGLDEWGNRTDGGRWAERTELCDVRELAREGKVLRTDSEELRGLSRWEAKQRVRENIERHGREIALAMAQRSRSVTYA